MNRAEHRELRELLGAYALGNLPPAEEHRVRDHLQTCAPCRSEHDAIEPVAAQLGPLKIAAGDSSDHAPDDLQDRVVAAVASADRSHRRHRLTRTVSIAGIAAVAAALAAVLTVRALAPTPVPLEPVAVQVDVPGVEADADLVAHTWGVEIKLNATGLDLGRTFRASILTAEGDERTAGEFVGTGSREMHCNLNSGVLRPDAVGFVVVDDRGRAVIESTFAT